MMRFLKVSYVALVAFLSLAASCHPDPPEPPEPPIVILDTSYDFSPEGGSVTLTLTMEEAWTAKVIGGGKWCSLNRKSGGKGEATVIITISGNDTYSVRSCQVNIASAHSIAKIAINQEQLDILTGQPDHFDVPAEGGGFTPSITANVPYDVEVSDEDWVFWEEGKITVAENTSEDPRTATITLTSAGITFVFTIDQAGVTPPEPPDEVDGVVTVLQQHSEGAGVPIVFMGDAFSREQIEDGTYAGLLQKAAEAFFSVEPYTAFRDLFDLYAVNVVSPYYEDFNNPGSTTLGTYFGEGAYVGGDHAKCREYTLKAITEDEIDNVLVVILMNREVHAGRCYMQLVNTTGGDIPSEEIEDCARGIAFAYMALGTDDADFAGLVLHEAGGHGFGRLADEYYYEGVGAIPRQTAEQYKSVQTLNHAYMNIDFSSETENVLWARFLQDERYQNEDLGVFEGGGTYETGVWRPSQTSIMFSNEGEFNAPSREAIYFRIHKIAYGREWEYDFEKFVQYDAVNRKQTPDEEDAPTPAPARIKSSTRHQPCPSPDVCPVFSSPFRH